MKNILHGLAISLALSAPAFAADIPMRMPVKAPPPVAATYNWAGFYIGGHVGYGWGDSSFTGVGVVGPSFTEHEIDGVVGGLQTGINWQFGRLVLGIEGALSIEQLEGASACPNPAFSCQTEIDHFWRAGGRAGVAFGETGNWLIYGMGGFARAYNETRVVGAGGNGQDTTHHHGFYIGGGLEYAVSRNFIIGVEGYHVSLDTERHFLPGGAIVPGTTRDVDLDFSVVQARASYKFDWGGARSY